MTSADIESVAAAFDHHDPSMPTENWATYAALRAECPVGFSRANGGFWVASGYHEVHEAARDEETYSSENNKSTLRGVAIPALPNVTGMLETPPPRFLKLRKAMLPWYSSGAAESRRADIERITDHCIDQVIERGELDLVGDVTAPVPALFTMQFLGFPPGDSIWMRDLFHRHSYLAPNTPERAQMQAEMAELNGRIVERAAELRRNPRNDLLSFIANLEIDGELLPLNEVAENAFLVLTGGIGTTTALTTSTLLHLHHEPALRERLLNDRRFEASALEEFLRFFSPVQGLARTVTRNCTLGSQDLEPGDRLWLSWASANHDERVFDNAEEIVLDRPQNRHLAFGIGIHRCIGAHYAKVLWQSMVRSVLTRMGDYRVDVTHSRRFPTIPTTSGWMSMPATFTPGTVVGATLPNEGEA